LYFEYILLDFDTTKKLQNQRVYLILTKNCWNAYNLIIE